MVFTISPPQSGAAPVIANMSTVNTTGITIKANMIVGPEKSGDAVNSLKAAFFSGGMDTQVGFPKSRVADIASILPSLRAWRIRNFFFLNSVNLTAAPGYVKNP